MFKEVQAYWKTVDFEPKLRIKESLVVALEKSTHV